MSSFRLSSDGSTEPLKVGVMPGVINIKSDYTQSILDQLKQYMQPSYQADPRSALHEAKRDTTIAAQHERMSKLRRAYACRSEQTFADGKTCDELMEWLELDEPTPKDRLDHAITDMLPGTQWSWAHDPWAGDPGLDPWSASYPNDRLSTDEFRRIAMAPFKFDLKDVGLA